ncbi:MAG: discoidin domain-containing protein [Planctomycetaceae bacterium]|jgi:hypothetical protein|nr:discoidin domain-containing protein [Planctomycetaceae bacterium]
MKKTYLILTLFFVLLVTAWVVVGTFGNIAQNVVSITGPFVADQENRLTFTPVKAKFVRLEFQCSASSPALDEIEIYGTELPKTNLAASANGGKVTASSCISGYPIHKITHLNDGLYGNDHSWVAAETDEKPFICVEMKNATTIDTIIFSRDQFADFSDRLPKTINLTVSEDGRTFLQPQNIKLMIAPSKVKRPAKPKTWANVQTPPPPPSPITSSQNKTVSDIPVVTLPKDYPQKDQLGFDNLALGKNAIAGASSCISGYEIHQIKHLNDGLLGNDHSWIAAQNPCWVEIDLGDVYTVYRVAFGSDSTGKFLERQMSDYTILIATEYNVDSNAPTWKKVAPGKNAPCVQYRTEFIFVPVEARYVRIQITGTSFSMPARIDELEIFGRKGNIAPDEIGTPDIFLSSADNSPSLRATPVNAVEQELEWKTSLVDEEYAWLKAFGRADCDPYLKHTPYPIKKYPNMVPNDETTLVTTLEKPVLDGRLDEEFWSKISQGTVRVAKPDDFQTGALVEYQCYAFLSDNGLYVGMKTNRLLSSFLAILRTEKHGGVIVLDKQQIVWRQYNTDNSFIDTPLEFGIGEHLTEFEFHIPFNLLPDVDKGLLLHSGIGSQYTGNHGNPIYFYPGTLAISPLNFKNDYFHLRLTNHGKETITIDPESKLIATTLTISAGMSTEIALPSEKGTLGAEHNLVFYIPEAMSAICQLHLFQYDPVSRTLDLFEAMLNRVPAEISEEYSQHVAVARKKLNELRKKAKDVVFGSPEERELFYEARKSKREFFFADPNLSQIETILFEKRHPLLPSHNYSDSYDSVWREGGGIYTLKIPNENGHFVPEKAVLTELFQTTGMSRHPTADFDVAKIYFTNRPSFKDYWHIMEMNPDGSELRQLTDGPFHDLWPCPLPDGDLAFISTRCRQKFLCWEPQASVLHRMDKNGQNIKRLSFANLTEFAPSVARDGRILWTRSEYLDKGADYGHTLWYIHPDGAAPELTFGNTIILPQGYANGREIPDTKEIACVMISHFGDLNGPVAILDIDKGRLNSEAITNITPEIPWPGFWARTETFREPFPVSTNLFLVSHSPRDRFALYVIDRFGNREMLYIDKVLGSMCPTPLQVRQKPQVLTSTIEPTLASENLGVFTLEDVYMGIDHVVPRGSAKYLRVCQEMPHFLEKYEDGTYRFTHQPYMEFYASPVDLIVGPYGWTSYVAKGDLGTVELEKDGSASFVAPSGSVLFFELLDENYTEIQRMRSVVQLQPGEIRSCVGCHEDRASTPTTRRRTLAAQQSPKRLTPPPWGTGAFDYQKAVQPVFDKNCISCHNTDNPQKIDLSGSLDKDFIPASFKTLIRGGYVHHFNWGYQAGIPTKAEPYTFGTIQSRIWSILKDENHKDVTLSQEEERAIKCWIDLSCPLWPNYKQRRLRDNPNAHDGTTLTN